ncbi:MAG: hypothetical protein ACHBN1_19495 [Heteroscytonema crispum UTEX LB 1556]
MVNMWWLGAWLVVSSWWVILNNPTGEPVAWVGKTPLRPLARPQDRSGSPTKGAKLTGGNLPDCRLRAPSPTPNPQQPNGRTSYLRSCYPPAVRASPTPNPQQPNGRTSYLRSCYPPAVRASPTPNPQPPTTQRENQSPAVVLPYQGRWFTNNQQPTTNNQQFLIFDNSSLEKWQSNLLSITVWAMILS